MSARSAQHMHAIALRVSLAMQCHGFARSLDQSLA